MPDQDRQLIVHHNVNGSTGVCRLTACDQPELTNQGDRRE